jgi:hypothetical protein
MKLTEWIKQQAAAGIASGDPTVQDWLSDCVHHSSEITTEWLTDDLKAEFEQASRAGEGLRELTARIQAFFGDMCESKAEAIARTVTSRTQHQKMIRDWKQSDVVEGAQWESQGGSCPLCQALDGKVVKLGENFLNLNDSITVDGQSLTVDYVVSTPPAHTGCACSLLAVLKEN